MIEASNRIRDDAHAAWFQYLPDAGEAADWIREMHEQGANKRDVILATDTRLGNLRRISPDGFNPGPQQRMAYEEVEATDTVARCRLKANNVLAARRWKVHGRNVRRTHLLKQKAEETTGPTDIEHPLAGKVRKPVRGKHGTMIVVPVYHETVSHFDRVVKAYLSAECDEIRVRQSIELLYRRNLFGSDRTLRHHDNCR